MLFTVEKLKNRRVCVCDYEDGLGVMFKRLGDKKKGEPRVVITKFSISKEAAVALADLIRYKLGRSA